MKVFATASVPAAKRSSVLRARIAAGVRRFCDAVTAVNEGLDRARMSRDMANQTNHTVDRDYWIHLR